MDADISENSINILRMVRRGTYHYIENTNHEVQSKFKEQYTPKEDDWWVELYKALDNDEKIVIPCLRSTKKQEAMRQLILKKYPHKRVQVFNSNTRRDADVNREMEDTDSWKNYDVVMYSPTISAGVSIEYEYFDKCFCFFVSCGKTNSMRQMINRVRKFKTNEFYFCLQSVGGCAKPQQFRAMEQHISANRYIEQPAFILSKENVNGTRSYPYKDLGYHMWIYNEIETSRDKNNFLFNFMREQYHSGVGSMRMMGCSDVSDSSDVPERQSKVIARISRDLDADECEQIANARPISEDERANITLKLEREEPVSNDEMNRLRRFNISKHYDINHDATLTGGFVHKFRAPLLKSAFTNRKLLTNGIGALCASESIYFNDLFLDRTTVQDDLKKKYASMKLVIATEFINICGFDGIYDRTHIDRDDIMTNLNAWNDTLIKKMDGICIILGKGKRHKPNAETWTFKTKMQFINSVLTDMLSLKISPIKRNSTTYRIDGIDTYDFNSILGQVE
jgi:tartrate dehydratase beta subunit/fumarate hydratase class I family protein